MGEEKKMINSMLNCRLEKSKGRELFCNVKGGLEMINSHISSKVESYFGLIFQKILTIYFFSSYRKDCKRCVVIYEKHHNVLQYKESECEIEQNKPASAAISSVIRSDYNTDARFQGNEQYMDSEGMCNLQITQIASTATLCVLIN